MEYYNYIIGTGDMPNFDIDDPNEKKFNNLISKLLENDKYLFYNDPQQQQRMGELYKNLTKADFLYTYLFIDEDKIKLNEEEIKNFEDSMSLHIHINVLDEIRNIPNSEKNDYIIKLMRIQFIREFVDADYKNHEDILYGSLDKIIIGLKNDIKTFIQWNPVQEWTREYEKYKKDMAIEKNRQLDLDHVEVKKPRISV